MQADDAPGGTSLEMKTYFQSAAKFENSFSDFC
jgi:hypothetical protein